MEGGQMKAGVRNALMVLLFVILTVPSLKVGVNKFADKLPEWFVNWVNSI